VAALIQGLTVNAVERFTRASDLLPTSAVPVSNLGLAYYIDGDHEGATRVLKSAVERDPTLGAARDLLGRTYFERGDVFNCIEHWEALVQLEPTNITAIINLGVAYYRHGQLDYAITQFKKALLLAPQLIEAHNDLGLAYAKNAQAIRGELKLHERYEPTVTGPSPKIALMVQMLDQAIYHLGRVLDTRPDNPITHSNFGLALYFRGEVEKSMFEWMEVTRLSPAYARVREATRLSAYDDSEMVIHPLDRASRMVRFPPKPADFMYSFEFFYDENALELELPWLDIAQVDKWQRRCRAAAQALARLRPASRAS